MMAPMHHPAIAHVMPTRAELGTRTIFNILGPLTNPAGVTRQLNRRLCTRTGSPHGRNSAGAWVRGGLAGAWF